MQMTYPQAYTDTFVHAFDEKGRITVPKEWRGGGFEDVLHVIPSAKGCLMVFPASYLGRKLAELAEAKVPRADPRRQALEQLASSIQAVGLDPQHRMAVKEKFRREAGLKKEAVLAGMFDHFEVWAPAEWKKRREGAEMVFEDADKLVGLWS
jgi:MraZ protein